MSRSLSSCLTLLIVAFIFLIPVTAVAGGKVGAYATRIQPNGQDAEKYSRISWGGGIEAVVPFHRVHDLLAFAGGAELIRMLGQTTEYREATGLRIEQQTNQDYARLFVGGRFGPHGPGFVRPHVGVNVALVIYDIRTDVVVPDDTDRQNEIRQNLQSETRTVFGYDFNAGVDFNIANAFPLEIGARYLKSFGVPQQLGEGSVRVSPEYFQIYFGFGVGFDALHRLGGS